MEDKKFITAIIGLGLMGGSFAYALRGFRDCTIIGYDKNSDVCLKALAAGAVDKVADSISEAVEHADLIIFCTYPRTIVDDAIANRHVFKRDAVVTEICGVKAEISEKLSSALPDKVDYIGIHPMAGKEVDGFDNADGALFKNSGFILTIPPDCRESSVNLISEMSAYVGARRVCVNSPGEHDEIIAYTSDLMHIAATALCARYPKNMTMAHTAGAFRDCTRVANINPELWTELFMMNKENTLLHLSGFIDELSYFKKSLEDEDESKMREFLSRACRNKRDMQNL